MPRSARETRQGIESAQRSTHRARAGWGIASRQSHEGSRVKVLLVDDSEAVRASFGGLLAALPDVELVGCADDVAGALSLIETRSPDLVVLDVELRRGEHGLTVLRHVMRTRPGLRVVVLSNFTWRALRGAALAAGAAAYFDKSNEFMRARDWIACRAAAGSKADSTQAP